MLLDHSKCILGLVFRPVHRRSLNLCWNKPTCTTKTSFLVKEWEMENRHRAVISNNLLTSNDSQCSSVLNFPCCILLSWLERPLEGDFWVFRHADVRVKQTGPCSQMAWLAWLAIRAHGWFVAQHIPGSLCLCSKITVISVFWKRSEQSFPGQVTHCHHSTQMSAVTISYLQEIVAWIKKNNQPKTKQKGEFLPTKQHTANINDCLLHEKM